MQYVGIKEMENEGSDMNCVDKKINCVNTAHVSCLDYSTNSTWENEK